MALPMSDQRRPTARFGRAKRDPRMDSTPPSSARKGPDSKREGEAALPLVGDIDELLGRLLARATQAEVHSKQLEQMLQRMNEERVMLDARLADLQRQLEDADTMRASLEVQAKTAASQRRTDGPVTLAYVRSMAAELVRALDRITPARSTSDLPLPLVGRTTPSEIPTPRPRSDRPRR
jgi:hypothetical protein